MTRPFCVLHRADELAEAAEGVLDVLVIGLGATGAGVALDAASRGLRVAAVDMGDLASGTSSKSSKLIHGGLRYLENYEFGLVAEGVSERQTLLRLAPHLVRPMDFVFPVWPDTERRRLLGLGLAAYDVFAGLRGVRRHDRISAEEAVCRAPALADSGCDYAYVYGDSATDDARLVLAVTRAARDFGALTLTYAEVTGLLADGEGRVAGARVADRLAGGGDRTDGEVELRARHVVNATGVWVDRLMGMADARAPGTTRPSPRVKPSKGVHVVVPHDRLPLSEASVLLPSKQGDRRAMFAIAWGRQTILGTTDTAYDGPLDAPSITDDDLDYVLAAGNAVFGRGLTPDDVVGGWAGVRPLLRMDGRGDAVGDAPGDPESMSDLSRRHVLLEGEHGLLTITGGKLTTYRRMARDVVDRIAERDRLRAKSRTDDIGLGLSAPLDSFRAEIVDAAALLGVSEPVAKLLVRQHGEAAADVLSLVAADPAYTAPLSPATDHLLAEVVQAALAEGAATLDDVLSRRTRVALRAADAGLPMAATAARVLARETGRDDEWAAGQVAAYADGVRRERGVVGLAGQPTEE